MEKMNTVIIDLREDVDYEAALSNLVQQIFNQFGKGDDWKVFMLRLYFNASNGERDYIESVLTMNFEEVYKTVESMTKIYAGWLKKVNNRKSFLERTGVQKEMDDLLASEGSVMDKQPEYERLQERLETFKLSPEVDGKIRRVIGEFKSTLERSIKDSGERETMTTGSMRDSRKGKGRYDLIPQYTLDCLSRLYEMGAEKYGDNNWQKGQPFSRFYDSAQRHLANWRNGLTDEPHLVQAIWNLISILELENLVALDERPKEIADMGYLVDLFNRLDDDTPY